MISRGAEGPKGQRVQEIPYPLWGGAYPLPLSRYRLGSPSSHTMGRDATMDETRDAANRGGALTYTGTGLCLG